MDADGVVVKVLIPLPFSKPYDYRAPASAGLRPGDWVRAPLGPNQRFGVVWPADQTDGAEPRFDESKLKSISEYGLAPPLAGDVMAFVEWVGAYTMAPLGAVLRLVMRSGDVLHPIKPLKAYVKAADFAERAQALRMTPARRAVLETLTPAPASAGEIATRAGVSDGVVRGLCKAGLLTSIDIDPDPPFAPPDLMGRGRALSGEQTSAVAAAQELITASAPPPLLIDGVTGAGKTEVYLEAVAAALRADPTAQALILLPEIALTLPFLKRVQDRFGAAPAPWHADVGQTERRRVWRRVLDGNARIVVGARSALFLPFKNLRLIVVDEEHEGAYKQDDGVVYQGRDMAVARGALAGMPIILASATPSLETAVNAAQGRYQVKRLKSRFGGATMPAVDLIDLRRNPPERDRWMAPPLVEAVNGTLARGEQSLLFINRRGYAPLTICRQCGHRMKAPDSDTWLVEHRFENRLVCHHTGFSMPKPNACPACKAVGGLSACGPGVERLAEEAGERWPDARLAVLSSDSAHSSGGMKSVLQKMEAGDIDILVATQVVAKGHHFPNLTLAGIVDADMGLAGGDLRAAERSYQLLSQVAGRAGRVAGKNGRAILQTHQPQAPLLDALARGDRNAFLAAEAAGREALGFPPFGRLAAIVLRSQNETVLKETARAHRAAAPSVDGVELWGPAPAPIYRLRGSARMRFLVKAGRSVHIQRYMADWLARVKLPNAVRRTVDIDPYSFL